MTRATSTHEAILKAKSEAAGKEVARSEAAGKEAHSKSEGKQAEEGKAQ
jgi:hypothetical protein